MLLHMTREVPGRLLRVFLLADQQPLIEAIKNYPMSQKLKEKISIKVDQSPTAGATIELIIPLEHTRDRENVFGHEGLDFLSEEPFIQALFKYREELRKAAETLDGTDGGRYIIEEYSVWIRFEKENGSYFSMECTPELLDPLYRQGFLNVDGVIVKYLTTYPGCEKFVPYAPEDKSPEALYDFFLKT